MSVIECQTCGGARLRPEALHVTVAGKNICETTGMAISEAETFFAELDLAPKKMEIARRILKEIRERLSFLTHVGPRLPDPRPQRRHLERWRRAAHPPGDPDRLIADRRPLYPR